MNERTVTFGPEQSLLGILSLPPNQASDPPAIILLNAGLLHRVGPNRLYVDIARRLSDLGYPGLRFDMSGVGDSALLDGHQLDIERSRREVIEAMDAVSAETGVTRFVLMGLCTGAYNAFRAAVVDERVVGCVLMDGYAYPTRRSQFIHYRTRAFELERWVGYVRRRFGKGTHRPEKTEDLIVFENEVVRKAGFESDLAKLIDRGTRLMMTYTKLGPLAFNYPRQMHDAFPSLDLDATVTVHYYADADHTFRLHGNRTRLLGDIESWIKTQFPISDRPTTAQLEETP